LPTMTATDRAGALRRAQQAVNDSYGKAQARGAKTGARLRNRPLVRRASQLGSFVGIDTNQPWFNELLSGIGGLPRTRVVNIFGPRDSGKSTFAQRAAAAVIADGGIAIYCDPEGKLDPEYAKALGVNTRELFLVDASGHTAFEAIRAFAAALAKEKLSVDLIVIDTVTALPTTLGRGVLPTMLNAELPLMLDLIKEHNACLLLLSQERAIPQGEDARVVSTGGYGLEHDSTVIVELTILKEFYGPNGVPTGHLVEARLRKLHAPGTMGRVKYVLPKLGVSGKELEAMLQAAPDAHPALVPANGKNGRANGRVPKVNGTARPGAKPLQGATTI
jgi:RecA/RadA recombinase